MTARLPKFLRSVLFLAAALLSVWAASRLYMRACYPRRYADAVTQYGAAYHVEPCLLYAVIRTESGFNPQAVSPLGARGLMQITEETFEWARWRLNDTGASYDDLYDPDSNIRYGAYILSLLLEEFGSVDTALAAYHAGWGSVKRWLENEAYSPDGVSLQEIPFENTRRYVPKVMRAQSVYGSLYR